MVPIFILHESQESLGDFIVSGAGFRHRLLMLSEHIAIEKGQGQVLRRLHLERAIVRHQQILQCRPVPRERRQVLQFCHRIFHHTWPQGR